MIRLEINGNYENVSENIEDFSFLIEKYMGYEAKNYFDDMIDQLCSYINQLEDENEELNKQIIDFGESDA